MTAQEWTDKAVAEIKAALKQFGEYQFGDKGANEVMDLDPLEDSLQDLAGDEAGTALLGVLDDESIPEGIRSRFVGDVLVDTQDATDEWWDALMAEERLADLC